MLWSQAGDLTTINYHKHPSCYILTFDRDIVTNSTLTNFNQPQLTLISTLV